MTEITQVDYVERITYYGDNEPFEEVLSIHLSPPNWCEFVKQPLYRALIQYFSDQGIPGSKGILDREISSMGTSVYELKNRYDL